MKKKKQYRSQEWLQEHGVCADNMYASISTIPQAGHGAFASRFLPEGSVILPIPLIHLPYRKVLDMYEIQKNTRNLSVNRSKRLGSQLLLNYCLGHANSRIIESSLFRAQETTKCAALKRLNFQK